MAEPVDARETTTDAQGRFVLPGKFVVAPRLPLSGFALRPWLFTYTPGYESVFLQHEQAYSQLDTKNSPLDAHSYRTEARPLLTVTTNGSVRLLEFRVAPLTTAAARADDVNTFFIRGPAAKFPNYLKAFNAERREHGLPPLTMK